MGPGLLLLALFAADPASLVADLGAASPARRNEAFSQLLAMGPDACPAAVDGLLGRDPTVRRACTNLLLRQPVHAARELRRAAHDPRAERLLDALERRECAYVAILVAESAPPRVFEAEVLVRAGDVRRLATPGPNGLDIEVHGVAGEGETIAGIAPLQAVSVRLDERLGLHVAPDHTYPAAIVLSPEARSRFLALALVRRCALAESAPSSRGVAERVESGLAARAVESLDLELARRYLAATGSPRLRELLEGHFRRGEYHLLPLLVVAGSDLAALSRDVPHGRESQFLESLPDLPEAAWTALHRGCPEHVRKGLHAAAAGTDRLNLHVALRRRSGVSPERFYRVLFALSRGRRADRALLFRVGAEDVRGGGAWGTAAARTLHKDGRPVPDLATALVLLHALEQDACEPEAAALVREVLERAAPAPRGGALDAWSAALEAAYRR